MSDYPMLISNKLHSFRNFQTQRYFFLTKIKTAKKFRENILPNINHKNPKTLNLNSFSRHLNFNNI